MSLTRLDDASLIAIHVQNCLDGFHDVDKEYNKADPVIRNKVPPGTIRDALGQFRLWVGNIGAHRKGRASLDYKLREASHIRDRVIELLHNLESVLREALELVTGERVPWEDLSDSESDTSEDLSPLDDEAPTELAQLASSMTEINSCLMRLSLAIRNPAPHDQFQQSSQIDVTHFEAFDVEHVRGKFPSAAEYLVLRLGKAISRRRQYLRYRQEHRKKLEQGLPSQPPPQEVESKQEVIRTITASSEKIESTVASSIPLAIKASTSTSNLDDIDYYEDTLSQTSYASSSNDSSRLRPPPLPEAGQDGDPFECPLCFRFTSVRQTPAWQKHVYRDLQPYVCTFNQCEIPDRTYESRHEWFQHEIHAHRKWWECIEGCNMKFRCLDDFQGHLAAEHSDMAASSRTSDLVRNCERQDSMDMSASCPLCKINLPSLTQLRRHLGKHHEELSLFALPSHMKDDENEDEDDGVDDGSRSSIAGSDALTTMETNTLYIKARQLLQERPSIVEAMDNHILDSTLLDEATRILKPDDVNTWVQYKRWLVNRAKLEDSPVDIQHVHVLQAIMFHMITVTQETDEYFQWLIAHHTNIGMRPVGEMQFSLEGRMVTIYQIIKAIFSRGGMRDLEETQDWADLGYHLGWNEMLTLDAVQDLKRTLHFYAVPYGAAYRESADATSKDSSRVNLAIHIKSDLDDTLCELLGVPRSTTIRNLRGLILNAEPELEAPERMRLSFEGRILWHSDTLDSILPHEEEASIHVDFAESSPVEVPLPGLVDLGTELPEIGIPTPGRLVITHDRWLYLPQSTNQCFQVNLYGIHKLKVDSSTHIEIQGPLQELKSGSWATLPNNKVFLEFHDRLDLHAACQHVRNKISQKSLDQQTLSDESSMKNPVLSASTNGESYNIRIIAGTLVSKKVPATIQILNKKLVIEVTPQLVWSLENTGPDNEPHGASKARLPPHNNRIEIRGMKNDDTGEIEDVLFKAVPGETVKIWAMIQKFLKGEQRDDTASISESTTTDDPSTTEIPQKEDALQLPQAEPSVTSPTSPTHTAGESYGIGVITGTPIMKLPSTIQIVDATLIIDFRGQMTWTLEYVDYGGQLRRPHQAHLSHNDHIQIIGMENQNTGAREDVLFIAQVHEETSKIWTMVQKFLRIEEVDVATLTLEESTMSEVPERIDDSEADQPSSSPDTRPDWQDFSERKSGDILATVSGLPGLGTPTTVIVKFQRSGMVLKAPKSHLSRSWWCPFSRIGCPSKSELQPVVSVDAGVFQGLPQDLAQSSVIASSLRLTADNDFDAATIFDGLKYHWDQNLIAHGEGQSAETPEDVSDSAFEDFHSSLSLLSETGASIQRYTAKVIGLPKGQWTSTAGTIVDVQLRRRMIWFEPPSDSPQKVVMYYNRMETVDMGDRVVNVRGDVTTGTKRLQDNKHVIDWTSCQISLEPRFDKDLVEIYQQIVDKRAAVDDAAQSEASDSPAVDAIAEESTDDEPSLAPGLHQPSEEGEVLAENVSESDTDADIRLSTRGYVAEGDMSHCDSSRCEYAYLHMSPEGIDFTPQFEYATRNSSRWRNLERIEYVDHLPRWKYLALLFGHSGRTVFLQTGVADAAAVLKAAHRYRPGAKISRRPTPSLAQSEHDDQAAPLHDWTIEKLQDFENNLAHFGTDWSAMANHMGYKDESMLKDRYRFMVDEGRIDLQRMAKEADGRRERGEDLGPPPVPLSATASQNDFDPQLTLWSLEKAKPTDDWADVEPQQQHVALRELQEELEKFKQRGLTAKGVLDDLDSPNCRKQINRLADDQTKKLQKLNKSLKYIIAFILGKWKYIDGGRKRHKALARVQVILQTVPSNLVEPPPPFGHNNGGHGPPPPPPPPKSENESEESYSELLAKHQAFDDDPPLSETAERAGDPTLPGGWFDKLYKELPAFPFDSKQPDDETVDNEFAAFMGDEYSWIPSASRHTAKAYSTNRKWALLRAVRERTRRGDGSTQRTTIADAVSPGPQTVSHETVLPVSHAQEPGSPTLSDDSRDSSHDLLYDDIEEENYAFLKKVLADDGILSEADPASTNPASKELDLAGPSSKLGGEKPTNNPILHSSRPFSTAESWAAYHFEMHARECSQCHDAYEVHRNHDELCSEGHRLAQEVSRYIYKGSDGITYSTSKEDDKLVRVKIPDEYVEVSSLLRAIERSLRHKRRRPFVSLDFNSLMALRLSSDENGESGTASSDSGEYTRDMAERMKELNVDSESSDFGEQISMKLSKKEKKKKKKKKKKKSKPSLSQGIEGEKSYSDNDAQDDVGLQDRKTEPELAFIRCAWQNLTFDVSLDLNWNYQAFLRVIEVVRFNRDMAFNLSTASFEFNALVDGLRKSFSLGPAPVVSDADWKGAVDWLRDHKRSLRHCVIEEQDGAATSSRSSETTDQPNYSERIQLRCVWAHLVFNIWLEMNLPCQGFLNALKAMLDSRDAGIDFSTTLLEFTPLDMRTDHQTPLPKFVLPLAQGRVELEWNACVEWLRKNKREEAPHMSADLWHGTVQRSTQVVDDNPLEYKDFDPVPSERVESDVQTTKEVIAEHVSNAATVHVDDGMKERDVDSDTSDFLPDPPPTSKRSGLKKNKTPYVEVETSYSEDDAVHVRNPERIRLECTWQDQVYKIWVNLNLNIHAFRHAMMGGIQHHQIKFPDYSGATPRAIFLEISPHKDPGASSASFTLCYEFKRLFADWDDFTAWARSHKAAMSPHLYAQLTLRDIPGQDSEDEDTDVGPGEPPRRRVPAHDNTPQHITIRISWGLKVLQTRADCGNGWQIFVSELRPFLHDLASKLDLETASLDFRTHDEGPCGTYPLSLVQKDLEVNWEHFLEWLRESKRADKPHLYANLRGASASSPERVSHDQPAEDEYTFAVPEAPLTSRDDELRMETKPNARGITGSSRIRMQLTWDKLQFFVWLDLNGSSEAAFESIRDKLFRRKVRFDRDLASLLLSTSPDSAHDEPCVVFLEQFYLEADWGRTVQWIRANRRQHAPHVYGHIELMYEHAPGSSENTNADAMSESPIALKEVSTTPSKEESQEKIPMGIRCQWNTSHFDFMYHLGDPPPALIAALGVQLWKLTTPFDLIHTRLRFRSEEGTCDALLFLPLNINKLQPVWDEIVKWLRANTMETRSHGSKARLHISAALLENHTLVEGVRENNVPFHTYWSMSGAGRRELTTVSLRARDDSAKIPPRSDKEEKDESQVDQRYHSDDNSGPKHPAFRFVQPKASPSPSPPPSLTTRNSLGNIPKPIMTSPTVEVKKGPAFEEIPEQTDSGPYRIRIYRADATFVCFSTTLNLTVNKFIQIMTKGSVFQKEFEEYCIVFKNHYAARRLEDDEEPVRIQTRLLEESGYTDPQQIREVGREDISHICKFEFLPVSSLGWLTHPPKGKGRASTPPGSLEQEGTQRAQGQARTNVGRDQIEPWADATQQAAFANIARRYTSQEAADTDKDRTVADEQEEAALNKVDLGGTSPIHSRPYHFQQVHHFIQGEPSETPSNRGRLTQYEIMAEHGRRINATVVKHTWKTTDRRVITGNIASGNTVQINSSILPEEASALQKAQSEMRNPTPSGSHSEAQSAPSMSHDAADSGKVDTTDTCKHCEVYSIDAGPSGSIDRWICCQCGGDNSFQRSARCTHGFCQHSFRR